MWWFTGAILAPIGLSSGVLSAVLVAILNRDPQSICYAVAWIFIVALTVAASEQRKTLRIVMAAITAVDELRAGFDIRVVEVDFQDNAPAWFDTTHRSIYLLRVSPKPSSAALASWGAFTDPNGVSVAITTDNGSDELGGILEFFLLHEVGHISSAGWMHKSWEDSKLRIGILDVLPGVFIAIGYSRPLVALALIVLYHFALPRGLGEIAADNHAIVTIIRRRGLTQAHNIARSVKRIIWREVRHASDKMQQTRGSFQDWKRHAIVRRERAGQLQNLERIDQLLETNEIGDQQTLLVRLSPLHFFILIRTVGFFSIATWCLFSRQSPSSTITLVAMFAVPLIFLFARNQFKTIEVVRSELRKSVDGLKRSQSHSSPPERYFSP